MERSTGESLFGRCAGSPDIVRLQKKHSNKTLLSPCDNTAPLAGGPTETDKGINIVRKRQQQSMGRQLAVCCRSNSTFGILVGYSELAAAYRTDCASSCRSCVGSVVYVIVCTEIGRARSPRRIRVVYEVEDEDEDKDKGEVGCGSEEIATMSMKRAWQV